jgi:hypothetical protein
MVYLFIDDPPNFVFYGLLYQLPPQSQPKRFLEVSRFPKIVTKMGISASEAEEKCYNLDSFKRIEEFSLEKMFYDYRFANRQGFPRVSESA